MCYVVNNCDKHIFHEISKLDSPFIQIKLSMKFKVLDTIKYRIEVASFYVIIYFIMSLLQKYPMFCTENPWRRIYKLKNYSEITRVLHKKKIDFVFIVCRL